MRNPLVTLAFAALTGLNLNLARAEEPTAPPTPAVTPVADPLIIPAPPLNMTNPGTYYVVLGSDTYANAPGLPGAEGATYDCQAVKNHLTKTLRYPETQVMSLCGPELVRERLFRSLSAFLVHGVPSGSTVVVIWIGHGGTAPGANIHQWVASDASFSMYPGAQESLANTGYLLNGITPDVLYREMVRVVPVNTNVVFVTDTARGGTYDAGGVTLELIGPSAEDFEALGMKNVYALSPTPGKSVPVGLTRQTLITCLNPQTMGLSVDTREFLGCYAEGMTRVGGLTIETTGPWNEMNYLFVFPTPPPPVAAKKKVSAPKVTLVVAGGALVVAGGVQAYRGYTEATALSEDIADGKYGVEGDPELDAAVERYNALGTLQPLWYAMGGAGLGAVAVGIAIPNGNKPASPEVVVYLSPTGAGVYWDF